MPVLTIPNTFTPSTVASSSEVNANFSAIATLINSTKLDNTNIQTGGISAANLAADSVTTIKILDANVTAAKLASDSVTTAKILAANVTQAKLAARATGTTVAAGGVAVGTDSGVVNTNAAPVLLSSCTITTTGRPVWLMLQGSPTSTTYLGAATGGDNAISFTVYFKRGATTLTINDCRLGTASSGAVSLRLPPSAFQFLDLVAAGTYTYEAYVNGVSGSYNAIADEVSLVAFEI